MKRLLLCMLMSVAVLFAQDDAADTGLPDPPPAQAADTADAAPVAPYQPPRSELPTVNRTEMYTNMMGSLLLVLGLIMMLAYGAKKLFPNQLMGGADGKSLRLIQSLPMGPKRAVALIEADGKRLLVGVTDQQINLIRALDEVDFNQTLQDVEPPKTVSELMGEEVP